MGKLTSSEAFHTGSAVFDVQIIDHYIAERVLATSLTVVIWSQNP